MKREYVPPPIQRTSQGKIRWAKHTPRKSDGIRAEQKSNTIDLSKINLNDIIESKKPAGHALTLESVQNRFTDILEAPPRIEEPTTTRYYNYNKPGWIRKGDMKSEVPIECLSESAAHLLKYICDAEHPNGAIAMFSMGAGTIYIQRVEDTIRQ
jgi:hypothetical protein